MAFFCRIHPLKSLWSNTSTETNNLVNFAPDRVTAQTWAHSQMDWMTPHTLQALPE